MSHTVRTTTELQDESRYIVTVQPEVSAPSQPSRRLSLAENLHHTQVASVSEHEIKAWNKNIKSEKKIACLIQEMQQSGIFNEELEEWIKGYSEIDSDDFQRQLLAFSVLLLQIIRPKVAPMLIEQDPANDELISTLMDWDDDCVEKIESFLPGEDVEQFLKEIQRFLSDQLNFEESGAYDAIATQYTDAAFQVMLDRLHERCVRNGNACITRMQKLYEATEDTANGIANMAVERIHALTERLTQQLRVSCEKLEQMSVRVSTTNDACARTQSSLHKI